MITPRERVLMTVSHERPDRTPRDFWIEAPALRRLQAHLGLTDEEAILQALGIDFRHLNAVEPPHRELAPGTWQNYWGERFVYRETGWGRPRPTSLFQWPRVACYLRFESMCKWLWSSTGHTA